MSDKLISRILARVRGLLPEDWRGRAGKIFRGTWTRADEENTLLEISEERRLRRLGIDPDGISCKPP